MGNPHLETTFNNQTVSYKAVLEVIHSFDREFPNTADYENWMENEQYKYALVYAGKHYPPKRILSLVTGLDVANFSGGEQTNSVFEKLGMEIIPKPGITIRKTYLLTWNPRKFEWNEYSDNLNDFQKGFPPLLRHSCGNTKSIKAGDRVFLMRLGVNVKNPGIVVSGIVTTPSFEEETWNPGNISPTAYYIEFDPDAMLDPENYGVFDPTTVSEEFNWRPQRSGVSIPEDIVNRLEQAWEHYLTNTTQSNESIPLENQSFTEGARKLVILYRYERDPRARRACIDYYGTQCTVCGFDFYKEYGEIGKGYIHIHHLKPISNYDGQYEINPITDLRPVCPNCHAMLHRQNPPYSIEDIASFRDK